MFDGISDVNMVAEEGDIRYFACIAWSRASLNPFDKSVNARCTDSVFRTCLVALNRSHRQSTGPRDRCAC